jgi:hypothetical protein
MDLGQASRVAQLARLAPKLVEVCVARGSDGLALEQIIRRKMPALWAVQDEMVAPAVNP